MHHGRIYMSLAMLLFAVFAWGPQIQAQTHMASVPFDPAAYRVAVDPSRNLVYLPTGYFFSAGVEVVDGDRNSPTFYYTLAHITLPIDSEPLDLALNASSNRLYVADVVGGRLLVVDVSTNTYLTAIPVGPHPRGVAVNTATNRIYVAVPGNNTVAVINGDTNTVVGTIQFPAENPTPYGVAVNETTNRVYVTSFTTSGSLSVIDGANNSIMATIPVGSFPQNVEVNPLTDRVYVTNMTGGTVSVIRGSNNTIEATVSIGPVVDAVGVNSATGRIYLTSTLRRVVVLDGRVTSPTYNTLLSSVSFPTVMYDVAVNPGANIFYVATGMLGVFDDSPPSPAEGIAALITWVRSLNLAQGAGNSLEAKLSGALNAVNGGNSGSACNKLDAFVNEVQSHEDKQELTPLQARELIAEAVRIQGG